MLICVSSTGLRPGLVPDVDRPTEVGRLGLCVWAGAEELPAAVQLLQELPSLRGQSHTAVQGVEGLWRHHAVRSKRANAFDNDYHTNSLKLNLKYKVLFSAFPLTSTWPCLWSEPARPRAGTSCLRSTAPHCRCRWEVAWSMQCPPAICKTSSPGRTPVEPQYQQPKRCNTGVPCVTPRIAQNLNFTIKKL